MVDYILPPWCHWFRARMSKCDHINKHQQIRSVFPSDSMWSRSWHLSVFPVEWRLFQLLGYSQKPHPCLWTRSLMKAGGGECRLWQQSSGSNQRWLTSPVSFTCCTQAGKVRVPRMPPSDQVQWWARGLRGGSWYFCVCSRHSLSEV